MSKKAKMVSCKKCNNVIAESAKQCPYCGAKNKKPFYKRWWFVLILIIVVIVVVNSASSQIKKMSKENSEYKWPDSELASLISKPDSKYGEIISDRENHFSIKIYKTSSSQFEDYIDNCKLMGFTVDYSRTNSSYYADNLDGYSLSLIYNEKDKEMSIYLDKPSDKSSIYVQESERDTIVSEDKATEETAQIESESINAVEETQVLEDKSDLINGVDPDLKAFLDEYEEFMNQYTDFMVKYESSDDALGMMLDYTKMLQEYAEFTDKLEKYDTKEMSDADAAYYLEVTSRVTANMIKKMG
jgi:RNA polymerase subunit RPABC4/transcription elongation factor Spt4